jgi:hypothetical protein
MPDELKEPTVKRKKEESAAETEEEGSDVRSTRAAESKL